jgi:mRNA interferase RelE/StbE
MAWKLAWSAEAAQFMGRVEKPVAARMAKKLEAILEDPQRFLSRLSGHDDYRLRVGDHRIIVLLLHPENTVFVEKIGHRKNVYKKK